MQELNSCLQILPTCLQFSCAEEEWLLGHLCRGSWCISGAPSLSRAAEGLYTALLLERSSSLFWKEPRRHDTNSLSPSTCHGPTTLVSLLTAGDSAGGASSYSI